LAFGSMLPMLSRLWQHPHPRIFVLCLCQCSMCSFMLGYHVHEKAILLVTIPFSLYATTDCHALLRRTAASTYLSLAFSSVTSLFPLLYQPFEFIVKLSLALWHVLVVTLLASHHTNRISDSRRVRGVPLLTNFDQVYMASWIGIELVGTAMTLYQPSKFAFLPLLLTSVYCSIGLVRAWFSMSNLLRREIELLVEN